mmetsp:Transcript_47042/g.134651  ORF Transcript_47042/g.134651 Transcript_47042/m.134651 type:complete len:213 (+) Transcript_47042:1006-1644(+)
MSGVALLPQELGTAQEWPCPHLPTHNVDPLVHLQRQVCVAFDPLAIHVPHDSLGGGSHHERLGELAIRIHVDTRKLHFAIWTHFGRHRLEPVVSHDGTLLGEALHMCSLLRQEADRDQKREVRVLHAHFSELRVHEPLDVLPDGEAVWPQNLATAHWSIGDEVCGGDDVQVPLSVILCPSGDLDGLSSPRLSFLILFLLLVLLDLVLRRSQA